MSGWNYRVVRRVVAGEEIFNIHEAYYNSQGEVCALSVDPMYIQGSSLDELKRDLAMYGLALQKPVLDYDMLLADWETEEFFNKKNT